ncbi:MAG: enolase C-terminal domain-like protein [Pseudomonadota bacterium]|nr:enolase C-terminal domain-like protein [Pseudomonadota bacterium]
MARISGFEVFAVDLPFKMSFKHSAAERSTSSSVFLKCTTDSGDSGFGECLPREYVTGESQDSVFSLLSGEILPRLVGREFQSMRDLQDFLWKCDGKTPGWVDPDTPQTAAWCSLDLALLDAFGKHFGERALESERLASPPEFRYSGALSADKGLALAKSALKQRLFGIGQIKLKVSGDDDISSVKFLRGILGKGIDLRVDANMAWSYEVAMNAIKGMAECGVRSYEQPLAADDLDGLSRLVSQSGVGIMADESFSDGESLRQLVKRRACTGVNVRISKCGGLVASVKRAREALGAGLDVQLGCQVGESSLLSAAQLTFTACVHPVKYVEGCFGLRLLREDPSRPVLQFGYGGRPPKLGIRPGLGVQVNETALGRWVTRSATIGPPTN